MNAEVAAFLAKAGESLESAEADFTANRYNSCANRCYYACFQAAIAALLRAGIKSPAKANQWSHTFVHGAFVGQLINRQKRYDTTIRDSLALLLDLRQTADYRSQAVPQQKASRALRRTKAFLGEVRAIGGESR
jgi:uncharacterized protein (UPF0332 family)